MADRSSRAWHTGICSSMLHVYHELVRHHMTLWLDAGASSDALTTPRLRGFTVSEHQASH